jgi:hypothetical protein
LEKLFEERRYRIGMNVCRSVMEHFKMAIEVFLLHILKKFFTPHLFEEKRERQREERKRGAETESNRDRDRDRDRERDRDRDTDRQTDIET